MNLKIVDCHFATASRIIISASIRQRASLRRAFSEMLRNDLAYARVAAIITASGAYSLSRCRVDFDPATKIPINRLSPISPRCCNSRTASGTLEQELQRYYTCYRVCCSLTLEFPASIYADTCSGKISNVS